MEFFTTLIHAFISLAISLFVVKNFLFNKFNKSKKIVTLAKTTASGIVIFEIILYLLTTITVISCGGNDTICDLAYISLIFWLPFFIIISIITTLHWIKNETVTQDDTI